MKVIILTIHVQTKNIPRDKIRDDFLSYFKSLYNLGRKISEFSSIQSRKPVIISITQEGKAFKSITENHYETHEVPRMVHIILDILR